MVRTGPPKILCVDDKRQYLQIRKLVLEKCGCDVIAVPDPQTALLTIRENEVDLVFLNFHFAGGEWAPTRPGDSDDSPEPAAGHVNRRSKRARDCGIYRRCLSYER